MTFDISSRSERLDDRVFVEASAGTGKTFVIEHYIVREVLERALDPEKLALITFTNAAARELRCRLTKTFFTMHERLSGSVLEAPCPDYVQEILEKGVQARKEGSAKLYAAYERLPKATISTIHSFCDRLLLQWNEERDGIENGGWIGEVEQKEWLLEYLQEGTTLTPFQWSILSRHYRYEQEGLLSHLLSLIENPPQTPQAPQPLQAPGNAFQALVAKAQNFRGNFTNRKELKAKIIAAFEAIQNIADNGISQKALEKLCGFSLPKCFETPLKTPRQSLTELEEKTVAWVLAELWPTVQEQVDPKSIVSRLSREISKKFNDFLERTGKRTPTKVIQDVLALADVEDFRALAAQRIRWLVIDEFQDTDAAQWTIFSKLFLENPLWDGRALFVGDPKQAIYGFRNADVYSYVKAKKSFGEHHLKTLTVNFRASPSVVAAQNQLFAKDHHPWVFPLPRISESLSVSPCQACSLHPLPPIADGRAGIHMCLAQGSLGRKRRWPHSDLEQATLFPWMAREIMSLKNNGIELLQQAVLVRDRYQAKRVQCFLNSQAIPTCSWRLDTVSDSPIFAWLQKALLLAQAPSDHRRLCSLLMTFPTPYHMDLCRSITATHLGLWATCAAAWQEVQQAFYRAGIARMAQVMLDIPWNGKDRLADWIKSLPHGSELLIDFEHLCELLASLNLPKSLEAYSEALGQLESRFSLNASLLTRRADPSNAGVPILTMHRSKGLEFSVVFAIGCASRTQAPEGLPIAECEAEKLRQLYVAVTRAKRRCYLPLLIEGDNKPIIPGQASPLELLFAALTRPGDPSTSWLESVYGAMGQSLFASVVQTLGADISHSRMEEELASIPLCTPPDVEVQPPKPEPKLFGVSRNYSSFCSGRAGAYPPSSAKTWFCFTAPLAEPANPLEGPLLGTLFHKAMAEILSYPNERKGSVIEQRFPSLSPLLRCALGISLPSAQGPILINELPPSTMRLECPFLDREGDTFVRGTIDVLFAWKGFMYVIDWKTTDLDADFSPYEGQYAIYKRAVLRAFSDNACWGGFFCLFIRKGRGVYVV